MGLCPWGDQEIFDGSATFEVSLDAIPATDLFDTFTKTLCVGYDNVLLVLHVMVSRLGIVVVPIISLPGRPVESFFQIIGRKGHNLARNIKESIYIRVNNLTLNNNIGKFNLSHIWDRVLLNTKGLTLK